MISVEPDRRDVRVAEPPKPSGSRASSPLRRSPARREVAKASMLDGCRTLARAMSADGGPFFLGAQFSLFEVAVAPFWLRYVLVGGRLRGPLLPHLVLLPDGPRAQPSPFVRLPTRFHGVHNPFPTGGTRGECVYPVLQAMPEAHEILFFFTDGAIEYPREVDDWLKAAMLGPQQRCWQISPPLQQVCRAPLASKRSLMWPQRSTHGGLFLHAQGRKLQSCSSTLRAERLIRPLLRSSS